MSFGFVLGNLQGPEVTNHPVDVSRRPVSSKPKLLVPGNPLGAFYLDAIAFCKLGTKPSHANQNSLFATSREPKQILISVLLVKNLWSENIVEDFRVLRLLCRSLKLKRYPRSLVCSLVDLSSARSLTKLDPLDSIPYSRNSRSTKCTYTAY